jgi:hypothetical protein
MKPREPKNLRELADYVVDNADDIFIGNKPLSKLSTKAALKCFAGIIRRGQMPAPPPSVSPYPYGLPERTLAAVEDVHEPA